MKRSGSNIDDEAPNGKRQCPQTDLLTSLTQVLSEIRSTPSTGEISAEVMETFKVLMLQIEELSSDETNAEGKLIKDETEQCLESWLEDLVAKCEADGELELDFELSEDDELVLALALEDQEDGLDDENDDQHDSTLALNHQLLSLDDDDDVDDDEEIIIVDDDDTALDPQQIQIMA